MKKLFSFFLALACISILYSQNDVESVKSDLDKDEVKSHIYYLASDELKGRDTPSEGLDNAAEYISNHLKKYGVKPFGKYGNYFQPVKLKETSVPTSIKISIGDNTITKDAKAYLLSGGNTSIKEKFVFFDYGLQEDFQKNDVSGKIVITNVGDGKSKNPRDYYFLSVEKNKWAKEAGAKAFIEIYPNIPFQIVAFLTREKIGLNMSSEDEGEFYHIFLDAANDEFSSLIASNSKAEIIVEGKQNKRLDTKNVLGYVPGTDESLKDEYIVCTAHYDHIGVGEPDATGDSIYNGARDNAVGVTSLLISAKNIAKSPLRRSVIFAFFTAEEKGLLGSEWFVNNPPVEPKKMVYCLNNDNGSYTDTTIVSIPGLSKINTEEVIKEACLFFDLKATDDFPEANMLYSASDNIHFSKIGIPSVTYSLGFTSFNAEVRKYYHQANDEAESINYNYLNSFCGGYNLSLRLIGNMDNQPFWKEGDDYYEAGKKLYNN